MDCQRRALEALERRCAETRAELHTSEQKKDKRKHEHKDGNAAKLRRSSADQTDTKDPDASSTKGHVSFVGYTSGKDKELKEPAYLTLSHAVNPELLPTGIEVTNRKNVVTLVLDDLLQHGDSAQKYLQGSKSMKIENTILLDNYVPKSSIFGDRSLQDTSKRSKKHFSLKKHKQLGSFDLPREFHNFEMFKPMHEKWQSHISQVLKVAGKDQLPQCFLNADLHGAIIQVVSCKISSYIGVSGIMIRETKETFGIITQENIFRVVPKKLSVFSLQAGSWKVTLLGDKLAARSMVP